MNKLPLTDYERLELKYIALKNRYELQKHIINSNLYRKFFANVLNLSRKFKKIKLKDIMPIVIKNNTKPKIALIVDKEDWAFANIAKQITKYLSEYYEFIIIPTEIVEKVQDVLLMVQDCDLVHFFWRGFLYEAIDKYNLVNDAGMMGLDYNQFLKEYLYNLNISTCVYDHMYLDEENLIETKELTDLCPNYYVSSGILNKIYNELPINNKPICVITDGVELERFKPKKLERFDNVGERTIKIGWVGNSRWGEHDEKLKETKGVNTILKPAINELIDEGYNIEMYLADKNERMISHEDMPDYYNDIDIYICTSKTEGTPNPILEAMACGIPIISTDVGVVNELFGKLQKEYILKERTEECLKDTLKNIIKNPEIIKELSKENLNSIKDWTWSKKCEDFKKYFDLCLKER